MKFPFCKKYPLSVSCSENFYGSGESLGKTDFSLDIKGAFEVQIIVPDEDEEPDELLLAVYGEFSDFEEDYDPCTSISFPELLKEIRSEDIGYVISAFREYADFLESMGEGE